MAGPSFLFLFSAVPAPRVPRAERRMPVAHRGVVGGRA
ncbi:hypothetical protein SLI_5255 [Streptomyces lividans 1326]|uniref:Uncharacterized protein n=1 Tax=Streptomyces lividans 1326 TaxID=1200984 RepID=A0A7U9HCQ5_STRLI|nr:hypothetical protein SLI_5255 [Streptomyces lividans 1326]